MVFRGQDQPLPQRGGPPRGATTERPRTDLRLDGNERREDLQLRRTQGRGDAHGGDHAIARREEGRPGADLHADDRRGDLRHPRLRAHRRDPLGGVWRLRFRLAGDAHRGCQAQAHRVERRRHARRQVGALQASAGRGDQPRAGQAGKGPDGRSRPRQGVQQGGGPGRRLRHAAYPVHECRGALRVDGIFRAFLHPLHLGHHRQAQGRAARHRRLRGRAGRVDEIHLPRLRGRDLLRHLRHRLGGRPQLHHLRPADRRHGDPHVRRHADSPGCGHLVEPRREVQGQRDVLGADGDPRTQEAGSGLPAQVRPVEPEALVPRRRTARPADPRVDHGRTETAGHRQLLADRDRLADALDGARHRGHENQVRHAGFPGVRLQPQDLPRRRLRVRGERKRHRRRRAAAAAGLPVDRLGRRRALRQDLLQPLQGTAGLFVIRLGHQGRGGLPLHPGTHRRRHQRRRPPPWHARDRGGRAGALSDCRSGRGGRE